MSNLDGIWDLFGQLTQARNRWAHGGPKASPSDPGPTPKSAGGVATKLRDALIHDADNNHPWTHLEWVTPKPIVDFVAKLAKRIQPASVLDPVCGYGMLLAGAADAAEAKTVHGVEIHAGVLSIASIILEEQATLIHGDAMGPHESLLGHYDLIVADPPVLRMKLREEQASAIDLKSRSVNFSDALLVWAASRLSPNGVALVVVTAPLFFPEKKAKQVHEAIQNAGCRIGAAIHIPRGTRLNSGIVSYLVMVEPGEQENIFVGQLSPDPTHQDQLLANLMRRKPKGAPALGRLCPLSDFAGYESFVAPDILLRRARDCGWKGYAAAAVFPQHAKIRGEGKKEELGEDTESLYLKLVGKGRASTRIGDLRTGESQRLREVVHLKVDPKLADPTYLMHWFNESRIGRFSLDILKYGVTIPRIRVADLLHSTIYLPPISEQKLVVEAAAYLRKIQAETEELESELWSSTESADDLVERIHSINQEDHYEDWFETLPFPLASILWRDHASKESYQIRNKSLLHFFEATAAFLATIHLSAFMSDDQLWKEYGNSLSEKLLTQHLSLDRASFGAWKLVAERLGSVCSSFIKKTKHDGLWKQIYRTTNHKVVEMLSDSKLRRILQDANKFRNDWDGHGGVISEDAAKSFHDHLFDLVQNLRGVFGRNWQRYELIQPGDGRYREGVHHVTCKRIMGSRSTPFRSRVYESTHPLEADLLYLFDSVDQKGLQLRPFIQVIPSPKNQAAGCFIFNRLEKDGARWISYHFEQESEIFRASQGLDNALARFRGFNEVGE